MVVHRVHHGITVDFPHSLATKELLPVIEEFFTYHASRAKSENHLFAEGVLSGWWKDLKLNATQWNFQTMYDAVRKCIFISLLFKAMDGFSQVIKHCIMLY